VGWQIVPAVTAASGHCRFFQWYVFSNHKIAQSAKPSPQDFRVNLVKSRGFFDSLNTCFQWNRHASKFYRGVRRGLKTVSKPLRPSAVATHLIFRRCLRITIERNYCKDCDLSISTIHASAKSRLRRASRYRSPSSGLRDLSISRRAQQDFRSC